MLSRFRENIHELLAGYMNAVQTEYGGLETMDLMGSTTSNDMHGNIDNAFELAASDAESVERFDVSSAKLRSA